MLTSVPSVVGLSVEAPPPGEHGEAEDVSPSPH